MRRLKLLAPVLLLQWIAACGGDGGSPGPVAPPAPANRAPTATGTIPEVTLETGAETTVSVSGAFTDPDADALTYAAASNATGVATVSVSGGVVRVTGVAPGSATVTVTATDPGGRSATQTFMVTVTAANRAPEAAETIPDQNVAVGAEAMVDVSAAFTDPDDDALTYAAESDATGVATVDVSGGVVRVTGVAPGSATVTVTATDPGGRSATQTFMVTVTAANRAPEAAETIPDQNVAVGAEAMVDVSAAFTDPDDD
ncbi:MAG: Ig-like domain-containing protein, partial [Gammaproteobacteria bacterium]|nr:Ig-like domain-containing protein [Gammaproteobacteria bacterium]